MPETETAIHPLLQGDISWIEDWAHWKKLWDETTLAEFRHSLLHFGFDVAGGGGDRICFYLELADGCTSSEPSAMAGWKWKRHSPHAPLIRTSLGEFDDPDHLRAALGRKAFEVLCLRYFKNTTANPGWNWPSWIEYLFAEPVAGKLLWFFRVDGCCPRPTIANLPWWKKDHHAEVARQFAADFAKFAWKRGLDAWDGGFGESGRKLAERLERVRPQCAELLFALGEHSFLESEECTLDAATIARLKRRVMEATCIAGERGDRSRNPQTLPDAVADHIFGAGLVLVLETAEEERQRQKAVQAAKQDREAAEAARREAERKLKDLGSAT